MRRVAAIFSSVFTAAVAVAGMPAPLPVPPPTTVLRLADVTVERLQVVSFFLIALLVSAAAVWWLWAVLRRDVPQLPRLSFGGALAGVLLWGLLAVVVLTMISGARELMTPGAWKRAGPTYTLADPPASPEADRRRQLVALREALRAFADRHGGRYPDAGEASQIPDELWRTPGGGRYEYVPGLVREHDFGKLLAYEPDTNPRLVLYTDGLIAAVRPWKEGGP